MVKTTKTLVLTSALLGPVVGLSGCTGGSDNEDTSAGMDGDDGAMTGGDGGDGGTDDADETGGTPAGCSGKGDVDRYQLVESDIGADTEWTCDTVYVLAPDTHVFVNGAVLTIEPGTTVLGNSGSALVIEKDSQIVAEGTADAPIVLTSFQDSPARGDWGGLVMLGSASTNIGTGQAEGFATAPTYGGSDDAHNCGALAYLRVEYAGFAISEGNELNGITFYACGSGTSVHHVQSHMGADDGIECFGGTFDMDHVIVTGADDDALDLDQGFRGTLQYVFVHQDNSTGNHGLEWSNQGTDFAATPLTSPTLCNGTIVGSAAEKSKGFIFKEGNEAAVHSTIFTGASGEAGVLSNVETETLAMAGDITLRNNIFFGNGSPQFTSSTKSWTDEDWEGFVLDAGNNNLTEDPSLASATFGSPDITPGSVVAGAGAVASSCEDNDYIGAVDPAGDNWTAASWINYAP